MDEICLKKDVSYHSAHVAIPCTHDALAPDARTLHDACLLFKYFCVARDPMKVFIFLSLKNV